MSVNIICDGVFEERETFLLRQFVVDGILCEVRRQEQEDLEW